jgi:peptide/nickel transport system permease protein
MQLGQSTVTLQGVGRSRGSRRSPIRLALRFARAKPLGAAGGVIVIVFTLMALFAAWVAPYSYRETHLTAALQAPNHAFLLGTDPLGRDLLSRLVYGARISIVVGLGVVSLSLLIGLAIGLSSAYLGGAYDLILQRFVDAWMAFPGLIILLTIMAILGPGLLNVILTLGLAIGITSSRVVRGATLDVRQNLYIEAARSLGARGPRIMVQHLLPNIIAPVIVLATLTFGNAILVEAALSFLGLGVPPPAPSWGAMLSGDARTYMFNAPWLALWPGVFITAAVFAFNVLGDALRDVLDPRLRGSRA